MTGRLPGPGAAPTYGGFSSAPKPPKPEAKRSPRRSWRAPLALVVVALGAGVVAWTAGGHGLAPVRGPTSPAAAAPAPAPLARETPGAASLPAPPPARLEPPPPHSAKRALHALRVRTALARGPAVRGAVRPEFHCEWRLRRSERMVCADPELARLDRELNHAYGQAVRAGVPRAELRRAQDAWVMRRESAARSPATLAAYYRTRIVALRRLAQRG